MNKVRLHQSIDNKQSCKKQLYLCYQVGLNFGESAQKNDAETTIAAQKRTINIVLHYQYLKLKIMNKPR